MERSVEGREERGRSRTTWTMEFSHCRRVGYRRPEPSDTHSPRGLPNLCDFAPCTVVATLRPARAVCILRQPCVAVIHRGPSSAGAAGRLGGIELVGATALETVVPRLGGLSGFRRSAGVQSFGGGRPPISLGRTFRFWRAFRGFKHGKREGLEKIQAEFFACLGRPGA
jgi:hypothetical protein